MSEDTVLTDEVKSYIGREFGPRVWEVEKGAMRKIAEAIGDTNPLWQDEEYAKKTDYGSIIAPPTFLASLRVPETEVEMFKMKTPLKGFLNASNELEFFRPIKPGDVISVTDKCVDIVEREGKRGKMLVITTERTFRDQNGEVVALGRQTGIRR